VTTTAERQPARTQPTAGDQELDSPQQREIPNSGEGFPQTDLTAHGKDKVGQSGERLTDQPGLLIRSLMPVPAGRPWELVDLYFELAEQTLSTWRRFARIFYEGAEPSRR